MKKIALFVLAILSSLGCLAGDSVEVWFQNVAVPQGGAAEMVVRWDNQADSLRGFQFDLTLPEGVRLAGARLCETLAVSNPDLKVYVSNGIGGKATVLGFQIPTTPLPKGECDMVTLTFEADIAAATGAHDTTADRLEFTDGARKVSLDGTRTFTITVTPYDKEEHPLVASFHDIEMLRGETADMHVMLDNNMDGLSAFLIELILPDGIHLDGAQPGEGLAAVPNIEVSFNDRRPSDGHTVVVGVGMDGSTLPKGEYELLGLTFRADDEAHPGRFTVATSAVEFSEGNGESCVLPRSVFHVTVMPEVSEDLDICLAFADIDVPQGDVAEMAVGWTNGEEDIVGLQIEFTLPESISLKGVQPEDSLTLNADFAATEPGHYVIVCRSADGCPLQKGVQGLLRLEFHAEFDAPLGTIAVTTLPMEVARADEGSAFLPRQTFYLNVVPAIPIVKVSFPDIDMAPGWQREMSVRWDNHVENVRGFQIEMELPEGIRLVGAQAGDVFAATYPDFYILFSPNYHDKAMVIGMDRSMKAFQRGEYELVRLTFMADDNLSLGTRTVDVSHVEFAIDNGQKINTTERFHINVKEMEPMNGDVDYDGVVGIKDVTASVAAILGNPPSRFFAAYADLDGSGEVDVRDVMLIVGIILNGK
ncbi:MAG: hypothetical protein IKR05_04330 [Prevotella sp.]|nr:hypothetical protein [Prevotella sp.]